MFYCTRLQQFQEQIQQEKKDIWNSDIKDSLNVRSNAPVQVICSNSKYTCTSPSKTIKGKPTKLDEVKPKSKIKNK